MDVLVIGAGVTVYSRLTGTEQVLWTSRSLLPMGAMLTIAINGLALRPRYPVIVTAGTLLIMAASLVVGLLDPQTVISERIIDLAGGLEELSVGLYVGVMLMVASTGVVTAVFTLLARRTVQKAVQLERVNTSLVESQHEVVIEQKIAALTNLAAGVSHELNTPLGAMSSTTETTSRLAARVREILEADGGPELRHHPRLWRALESLEETTKVALDAGERIGSVAETLRQFIRLDESERKSVLITDVLEGTLKLLRHRFGQRITIQKSYDELPLLDSYPRRLNQVFYTIIQNAAESIDGQGTIAISARAVDGEVQVRISDTGRGIAPEKLESLFDVQFSPDASRVHATMGLPICRSVVRRHGGRISVESEVGKGTSFTIALPLSRSGTGGDGARVAR
jgi:signal transduction histidine kinase